jgi:A/G-specific adenine glycosylase
MVEHLEQSKIEWFRRQLRAWAGQNLRDFPWRRTSDPYAIFVAEFLLQKTAAATATPVYEAFMSRYPTLEDLVAAPVEDVACLLQPLGLAFRRISLITMQYVLQNVRPTSMLGRFMLF